jgi:hypothetical protein
VLRTERCYGGETDGVDVLLTVELAQVDVRTNVDVPEVDDDGVPYADSPPTTPTPTVG